MSLIDDALRKARAQVDAQSRSDTPEAPRPLPSSTVEPSHGLMRPAVIGSAAAVVVVGVVLTAGEILDPLNDLVERFSWIVLLAASSLALQLLLGEVVMTPAMNIAISGP